MATLIGHKNKVSLSKRVIVFTCILFVNNFALTVCDQKRDANQVKGARNDMNVSRPDPGIINYFSSDGYFSDTRQEEVLPFGGVNTKNEAKKLSASLRWLSVEEIGVVTMQVCMIIVYELSTWEPVISYPCLFITVVFGHFVPVISVV